MQKIGQGEFESVHGGLGVIARGARAVCGAALALFMTTTWAAAQDKTDCRAQDAVLAVETGASQESIAVPSDRLRAFVAQRGVALEAARERINRVGHATLRAELAESFAHLRERVPGFVAWTYGWTTSYVFSYELIWAGARAGAKSLWNSEAVTPAVQQSIDEAVTAAFRRRVLEPSAFEKGIAEGTATAAQTMTREWTLFLKDEEDAWRRFANAGCKVSAAQVKPAHVLSFRANANEFASPDAHALDEAQFGDVFARRALRPLGTRAVVLGLRVLEMGSIAAIPAALGIVGVTGVAAGFAAALTTAWTVDYILNAADAALNRVAFEEAIFQRLAEAERKIEERIEAALGLELSRRADVYARRLADIGS